MRLIVGSQYSVNITLAEYQYSVKVIMSGSACLSADADRQTLRESQGSRPAAPPANR